MGTRKPTGCSQVSLKILDQDRVYPRCKSIMNPCTVIHLNPIIFCFVLLTTWVDTNSYNQDTFALKAGAWYAVPKIVTGWDIWTKDLQFRHKTSPGQWWSCLSSSSSRFSSISFPLTSSPPSACPLWRCACGGGGCSNPFLLSHEDTHTHTHTHTEQTKQISCCLTRTRHLTKPGCLFTKQVQWASVRNLVEPV